MKQKSFVGFMAKFALLALFLLVCVQYVQAQNTTRDVAISRARSVFVASAYGNVANLKKLMTPAFYKENFPYSDAEVRRMLLSVPMAKRMQLVEQITNQSKVETRTNKAGDVMTVTFVNKETGKRISVQLRDENGKGDWKVFKYSY